MIVDADLLDKVWLAGLLEGEGSFDLQRGKYPRVRLAMTDRDVVGRAATLFGSSIRLTLKAWPEKPIWHAEKQGRDAAEIMRAILPFMGARRSQKIAEILSSVAFPGAADVTGGRYVSGAGTAYGRTLTRPPGLLSPRKELSSA